MFYVTKCPLIIATGMCHTRARLCKALSRLGGGRAQDGVPGDIPDLKQASFSLLWFPLPCLFGLCEIKRNSVKGLKNLHK